MAKRVGHIDIPGDVDVWPHELATAKALARAGHDVRFIKKSNIEHEKTPDCLVDGDCWELKAPRTSNARAVQRNLHRALRQAPCVVFDGRRMKQMSDKRILHEIEKWLPDLKSCKHLKYINSNGDVIDIK